MPDGDKGDLFTWVGVSKSIRSGEIFNSKGSLYFTLVSSLGKS